MADSEGNEGNGTISNEAADSSPEISDNDIKNRSERDFRSFRTKMYLLERALDEQQATCSYLREERDEAVTHNRLLRHEVKELQRGFYTGKQPRIKSRKYEKGPFDGDMSVVGCILALPSKLVRGLVNRAALFVWWTGSWANEGLSFLQIENKWVQLQRLKYEVEEDNFRLQNQVYALQELLVKKEAEIVRQIERNKDLTNRMDTKCGTFGADTGNRFDKIAKHIHTLAAFSENLSEEMETIKATMDCRLEQFERVNRDIGRLAEGQRLLEIAEKSLERRVENLTDASTHDCHHRNAETLQARKIVEDTTNNITDKTILPNAASQKPTVPSDEDKLKVKTSRQKRSSICKIFCCGCRAFVVFFLAFLVTGILFHFILVASSLRLPSVPVDEFYGVDLFALWSYFVNWLFRLVVTEWELGINRSRYTVSGTRTSGFYHLTRNN